MNNTSRFFTLICSVLIGLSALVSCDKENEQEDPEGVGVFILSNATTTPLFYFPEGTSDTLMIDTFALEVFEVYKAENSIASPEEFYEGKPLLIYKWNIDSTKLVQTYKEFPVVDSHWGVQKKDKLEYGVTHYTLFLHPGLLE